MFDSNHVQNDFIYQTGGSMLLGKFVHRTPSNIVFVYRTLYSSNWSPAHRL
jgi:hypothetical protein